MKKVFYLWICFLLVFNVCLPVYADENAVADISEYYNPDYEEYVKSLQGVSEEEFEKKLLLAPSEYSYNEDYVSDTNMYAARSSYSSTYDSIKDMSFDLKDIDSYPSSGVIGWSFAASDALEIYLRKKCSVDKDDCDFSAIRLMSQTSSTKVPDTYAMSDIEFYEGSFAMAAAYWLRNEHSLENENIKVMDTVSLSDLSRWSSEEQSENRINSIKRMIMDYGGVYTKYELFTDAFDQYYSSYNNNDGGEIISGRTIESGVVIIGWDDNYAIDRFGESKPSKPGAFKVLTNRVVESNVGTIHLGTYYISYDMVNFLSDISAVKKAFVGSYAKNTYEYDKKAHSGISHSNTTTNVYANKYVNSTGNAEKIKSITTYCEVPNSYFNVYISKDGSMANLEKVNIEGASNIGYNVSNMGYVTMELSDELIIDSDFTVAIEVRTPMTSAKSIPQERMPVNIASISGRCFVANNISDMKNGNYVDQGSHNNIIKVHTINSTREWYFGDAEFTSLGSYISEPKEFNGLTLSTGIQFRDKQKDVKGKVYSGNLDLIKVENETKNFINIKLDGPSNVYFIAQTNAAGHERRLSVYNDFLDETSYLTVNESSGYCYKYREERGCNIKIKAIDGTIRIYGIVVENYDDDKYSYVEDYSTRVWDFGNVTSDTTITSNTESDRGLRILATINKPVKYVVNNDTNEYSFKFINAVDLMGVGTDEYRSIAVDVRKNSNIYISARNLSSDARELIITDKYGCDLETKDNLQKVSVTNNCNTYKFSYLGDNDTIFIRSLSGSLRIYQVAVTDYENFVVDEIDCRFDNLADYAVGQNMNGISIGQLSFEGGSAGIMMCESTDQDFTKAVKIYGNNFTNASKLKMNISSSTDSSNNTPARKIRIKAKANNRYGKIVLSNQYGCVFGSSSLSTDKQEYVFDYNSDYETMYLYITVGTAEIYSISTTDVNYNASPTLININVKNGQTYRYLFNVENAPASNIFNYTIEYDPTKLKFIHIGKNNNFGAGRTDTSITNVYVNNGKITFNIVDPAEKDWSGIATAVVFEGIEDGNCTIRFSANKKIGW